MTPCSRILVVGTTPDYISLIDSRWPGRALFLTDPRHRAEAAEAPPDAPSEVLRALTRPDEALAALRRHLKQWQITLSGVACFDCESMALASQLARAFSLPYPTLEAVAACRSKFTSKQLWRAAGLPCPEAALVSDLAEASRFMARVGGPIVLKPLTGSGSELIFVCRTAEECARALQTMKQRLAEHPDTRMYSPGAEQPDPRQVFAIEEFVAGDEYSCDFLLDAGYAEIIRIARKVPATDMTFGTILAYEVPAALPRPLDRESFRKQIGAAARVVGLTRAICMLDFIVRDGKAIMIEIAPRPGGDCLPPLLSRCCGLDILGSALDLAEGRSITIPPPEQWKRLIGLRLFSKLAGVIRTIDDSALRSDPRVLEVHLKHGAGHRVILPPDDYESRLLGHVIFKPTPGRAVRDECDELVAHLQLEMEKQPCATTKC